MTHYFSGLCSFHAAYRGPKPHVAMVDIMSLIGELKETASVFVQSDDMVVVLDHSDKYPSQKKYHKQHYTKLSASIPRETVSAFSDACRTLGVSQSSVLTPVILEVIERAKKV